MFSNSPRCQVVPLPGNRVSFGIDGRERLCWHAAINAPRPFFFPIIGPSGLPLTRMGHPGAPNHDHHRSIWFAHHKVLGIDFWSDNTDAVIRQSGWLAYEDGQDEARMAVELEWIDGHDPSPLVRQELITAVSPGDDDELLVEVTTSLRSMAESLELGQTNFGLLAVRVAKSISAVFGDGVLTGADGTTTEKRLFGKAWPWIDYSGSIRDGTTEGITYFDHPANAGFPNKWHVRDDGWMGVSVCRDGPVLLSNDRPHTFRYLLHAHHGGIDAKRASAVAERFYESKPLSVVKSDRPHVHATIERVP